MPSILNATTTNGLVTSADNSGSLQLQTNNGTTAVTIDTSQNVGIGITTPQQTLHVNNSSSPRIKLTNATTGTGASDGSEISIFDADNSLRIINRESANILFGTADTERMRITSGGSLLVGQTGQTGSERVGITQTGATGQVIYAYATSGSFTGDVIQARIGTGASTSNTLFVGNTSDGTVVFQVLGNGNVRNSNNSYGALSDIKLKENIVDASPKLADLMQVKVRNYNFKDSQTHKQIGVIAQELEQVFPSMVEETIDRDAEGNDLGTTTKAVKYSVFVPMLIKAIQELKAELDATKAEVQALKEGK